MKIKKLLFSLVMVSFLVQGFASNIEDNAISFSDMTCELIELENIYQGLLHESQTIEKSEGALLIQAIDSENLKFLESNLNFSRYSDKINYLLSIGIAQDVITTHVVNATTSMFQEKHSNLNVGPCYDRWENTIASASAAFATCVIGASPTGVVGFAVCSVGYGIAVMAADELYEDCMSNNYGPHDAQGSSH